MNKQQQMMVIGAIVGIILLGGGAFFLLNRQPASSPDAPPGLKGSPSAPGPTSMSPMSAGPAAFGSGGMPSPGAPTPGRPATATNVRPGGAAPGANAPKVVEVRRAPSFRKDPFVIDWKLPVPPPYVFDEVDPIRLASDVVETPPSEPYEVREQPQMRVSGIMNGDGVYAIIERPEGVDVVKPGSTLDINVNGQTKRTYKVVSITKDRVKLRSQVGNVIFTQDVPLSDVAVGMAPRPGGGSFGPGAYPSGPGPGSFGSGGFPGRGPGSFGPQPGGSFGGSGGGRRGGGRGAPALQ